MKLALLDELIEARAERRSIAVLTDLQSGAQRLVGLDTELSEPERTAVRDALSDDSCQLIEERLFVHPYNPPLRMIVIGGVHIAQALVPMAELAGYAITIVDPRSAFANAERFEGGRISNLWPDEAMEELGIDARCAVVTLTHDPKIDDPALTFALRSDAFYIGALGSTRTHASRLERLKSQGIGEGALARIHAPIGLPIGSRSPSEIAVSILAEVTQVLRKGEP